MGKASKKKKKAEKVPKSGGVKTEVGRITSASKTTPLNLIIIAALVTVVTFIVFLPALQNKFVNWDDSIFVYENPHIRSLSPQFFQWAFTNKQYQWTPLRWISHALDFKIWKLNPLGHHLSNIIIHSLNAFLVVMLVAGLYEMRRRQTAPFSANQEDKGVGKKALLAGVITGLLFSLHPLRVESVVWVSERKDVLYAFFSLLSLISYLRYYGHLDDRQKKLLYYTLALVFFIMSVMSKAAAVTLPIVLVLLDLYPLERVSFRSGLDIWRRVIMEKLPFFAIGGAVTWINIGVHEEMGALVSLVSLPFIDRMLLAIKTFVFYLIKMIWPFNLTLIYGEPYNISNSAPETAGLLLFFTVITGLCIFLWYRGKRLWFAVWIYYIIMLLPVSVVKVYSLSFAQDRYTYMPSIGLFLLAGLFVAVIYEKVTNAEQWRPTFKIAGIAVAVAALISISYITIQQIGIWKNSIVFWNYVIEKAPQRVPAAHNNLGSAYQAAGMFDKAIEHHQIVLSLKPDYVRAHNNLGNAYQSKGLLDKAIEQYQTALKLKPDYFKALYNLGDAYHSAGQLDKAIEQYQAALKLNPDSSEAHNNLGITYQSKGLLDKAIEQYQAALKLNPDFSEAYNNLGIIYQSKGLLDKAIEHYQTATKLNPNSAEAHKNLGIAYMKKGLKNEAIRELRIALKIRPNLTGVRQTLEALNR